MALIQGQRGLQEGSSLAQLLEQRRSVRNPSRPPDLTEEEILQWADGYFAEADEWPTVKSGVISDSPGDTWSAINAALSIGSRGLPGGSSLAKLLAKARGKQNRKDLPALTEESILALADTFFKKNKSWPTDGSGPVDGLPGQSWKGINVALAKGLRGLPGGSTLTGLLQARRGIRNRMNLPDLTEEKILVWADAYHEKTGHWPKVKSGPINDAPGETWLAINHSLARGQRGLPGDSSLAKLLNERRQVPNRMDLPALSAEQILQWMEGFFSRAGHYPNRDSGAIKECPTETWAKVDGCLKAGCRGLAGGTSLALFIENYRNGTSCTA